ncbi:RPP14 [Bugula neritina]|uniref:RPP14 n=1 Tax=Bugula neritina TaxID=10212 RepID=A0A7J7KFQ7_BUGNE|nr:RPP14 [Bugula neritina]
MVHKMADENAESCQQANEDPKYKFKRIVSKLNALPYRYLKVEIILHNTQKLYATAKALKHVMNMSMRSLFGTLGGAVTFDIIRYSSESRVAIIRCPAKFYVKIRASLFTITQLGDTLVTLHTIQSSSHLMALACNSRDYIPSIPVV